MSDASDRTVLKDTHVVVTGAARGIGEALAVGVARAGARVTCLDIDEDGVKRVASEITEADGVATPSVCDITDPAAVEAALNQAIAANGDVTGLVANAGGAAGARAPFLELTPELWQRMIDRNLTGAFNCGLVFGRHFAGRGSGSIVFTTSIGADRAVANAVHYSAAKGGLQQLMRGMALELAPLGVRVNAVAPGYIVTPGNEATIDTPEGRAGFISQIPLGRLGRPADIAGAVVHLLGPESAYTNGATIRIDGGYALS